MGVLTPRSALVMGSSIGGENWSSREKNHGLLECH